MTDREQLEALAKIGNRWRATAPVDDDFVGLKNEFDRELTVATRHLDNPPLRFVLKDWVGTLGLRHQGVLLTAVRGCDTAPKDDASKLFTRCYREIILNPHVGDSAKSASFIEKVDELELIRRFLAYWKNLDHYPHHYVMHLVHAIEVIGWKHPDGNTAYQWRSFYLSLCRGLHVRHETCEEMDARLNADEQTFKEMQKV